MNKKLEIHQALFGYKDGHNLLASSTTIAPKIKQFLATITDSSGPENNKAFSQSYTGLPIQGTDFYGLFSTWIAPEMPRPGCVWSHLLLIQLADLARIPNLLLLRDLCSRPISSLNFVEYEHTLNPVHLLECKVDRETEDVVKHRFLLEAIYTRPMMDIVILDEDSKTWEKPIFDIWSQQWPRLRRQFAFSTGSIGDRRLAGVRFDLQIAPKNSERFWRYAEDHTLILSSSNSIIKSKDLTFYWLNIAEKDLLCFPDKGFRRFLFNYGSDIDSPRAAFSKLASVYQELINDNSKSQLHSILETVGGLFPSATEALRLKSLLLNQPNLFCNGDDKKNAWIVISFLANSDVTNSYRQVEIDFANFSRLIMEQRRSEIVAVLGRLIPNIKNPTIESLAKAIIHACDFEIFAEACEKNREVLPLFLEFNLSIASAIKTWMLPIHIQEHIFAILTKFSIGPEGWGEIVGAMITARTSVSVDDAVARAEEFSILGALRWFEDGKSQENLPSNVWKKALAAPAVTMLNRTRNLLPLHLAFTAWLAPPNEVRRVLSADRGDVQQLADGPLNALPIPLQTPTAFILLSIGLREESQSGGVKMVLKNFFVVHHALMTEKYSLESWSVLAPELPYIGWWSDWDNCKKLRKAVRNYLNERNLSSRLFDYAFSAEDRKLCKKVTGIYGDSTEPKDMD